MPLVIEGFSHGDRTNLNLPKVQEELLKDIVQNRETHCICQF